jgi:hypothetical protein
MMLECDADDACCHGEMLSVAEARRSCQMSTPAMRGRKQGLPDAPKGVETCQVTMGTCRRQRSGPNGSYSRPEFRWARRRSCAALPEFASGTKAGAKVGRQ